MTVPELILSGTPRDRGRAHGEAVRDLITDCIDRWRDDLAERIDPDRALGAVVGDTGFLAAADHHTPGLVEEVRGIAEGANQPFTTMFAWQLIDEVWWYVDEMLGPIQPRERCSAFAFHAVDRGWVGQTQDLPRHLDGGQVMLRYHDADGLEVLAPSIAGLLALNGMNDAGFAACITTLSQLAHSADGLSSGFIVPTLMRCRSVPAALDFLRSVPIASGNSFLFGSADESCGVEVSAETVAVLEGEHRHLHTNHALVVEPSFEYVRFLGSVDRLQQLDGAIDTGWGLDDLAALYQQAPVCRPRNSDEFAISVGTMFFELGPDPACHYAPGPLDTDELATYRFTMEGR